MSKPARRDGTPERNHNNKSEGRTSRRPTYRTEARPQFRPQGQNQDAGSDRESGRNVDNYVSNARPARHQHVADRKPPRPVGGGSSNSRRTSHSDSEKTRLQKVLAAAGVASRRMSEKLIDAGRVEVNGQIVTEQGMRVDPENDVIRVDGVRVIADEDLVTFALNKPRGIHSTMHDELGRPCLSDLVGERVAAGQRLFHVGRLDAQTEGLLLLTNDGELANRLMHPRYEISKTYLATVLGETDRELVRQLTAGIELDDGIATADDVQIIDVWQGRSLVKVVLHEGRKHIVRRMLKEAGFPVQALVRTKVHTVQLGEQKPGTMRALNRSELTSLYNAVGL